jgi:N4-(beta-N-acetylglucosaminyl)-L-asparaginase
MLSTAMLPGAAAAQNSALTETVVSSKNGLRACARAMELLGAGRDTLDAVISGVNIVEEDPEDSSVGYGGLPNEEGVVELDASVMHGPTRKCGSVASIRNIKTPSKVAQLVMQQTNHVMLAADGALRFARAMGMPEDNLLTEKSRLAWVMWKQSMRDPDGHTNWTDWVDAPGGKPSAQIRQLFPNADEEVLAWAARVVRHPPTGTINCLALNRKGEMSGVTTTSGLAWKIPGRVGDSPILGAGLWVDQDVGGAGSTGRGEENLRVAGAHTIVENMRHGMSAKDACLDALKRVARNFDNDQARLARFDINFYALRKDGDYCGSALWSGAWQGDQFQRAQFSVNQAGRGRLEDCVYLIERRRG